MTRNKTSSSAHTRTGVPSEVTTSPLSEEAPDEARPTNNISDTDNNKNRPRRKHRFGRLRRRKGLRFLPSISLPCLPKHQRRSYEEETRRKKEGGSDNDTKDTDAHTDYHQNDSPQNHCEVGFDVQSQLQSISEDPKASPSLQPTFRYDENKLKFMDTIDGDESVAKSSCGTYIDVIPRESVYYDANEDEVSSSSSEDSVILSPLAAPDLLLLDDDVEGDKEDEVPRKQRGSIFRRRFEQDNENDENLNQGNDGDGAESGMERILRKFSGSFRAASSRNVPDSFMTQVKNPNVRVPKKGFPGNLTPGEMEALEKFRKELRDQTKRSDAYRQMVDAFSPLEDESFALCRFLRARDFNLDEVWKMMDKLVDLWSEAHNDDFYPDTVKFIGAPSSVIQTVYPFIYIGNSKEGFPVGYFTIGDLSADGIECVTDMDRLVRFVWNIIMIQYVHQAGLAKAQKPDFVRFEGINVFDLGGLTASQINSKTLGVIKKVAVAGECFPETLNSLIIVNAPGFFSFTWNIIKKFLDPNTARKIEIFSNEKKARKRLLELIDEQNLPSDHGGLGPSIQSEMIKGGSSNSDNINVKRILYDVLTVKKKGEFKFRLEEGESVNFTMYTRSAGGANVTVVNADDHDGRSILSNEDIIHSQDAEEVVPYSKEVVSGLKGPGNFNMLVKPKLADGKNYFLAYGEVF